MRFWAAALVAGMVHADVGYLVETPTDYTKLTDGKFGGALYQVEVPESGYNDTVFLLDLHGSRAEMGFDTGFLVGDKTVASLLDIFDSITQGASVLNGVLEALLVWQWDIALSKQVPPQYLEEMEGITKGALAAGVKRDVGAVAAMAVVLANLPGDADDIVYVLLNELPMERRAELESQLGGRSLEETLKGFKWLNPGCSNFGVWGNRTTNPGAFFSGRNLDWTKDTGIMRQKLVTVYHPEGKQAHATVGFAGIVGALTGMSAGGLTVHEANLESDRDSFFGFPWTLRLRYIMEEATTLDAALDLWRATNNTAGFNHGVGSANDASMVLMETDAGHTAFFGSMDPREVAAADGDPRPSAVYRTNHGFDPDTIAHYQWNGTHADADSRLRYGLFPQLLDAVPLGAFDALDAVNVTAVLGQKGPDYFHCGGPGTYDDGSNVLSVAFEPKATAGTLYAAWENGAAATWVPAACGTYVRFDMESWW